MSKNTEVVFGIHAVRHALNRSPDTILELWIQDGKQGTDEINEITGLAETVGIPVQSVSREAIEKAAADTVHQGVLLRRRTSRHITELEPLLDSIQDGNPLLLVLDGIQDPHNLGACLRTANAAGVDAVIVPRDRAVAVTATGHHFLSHLLNSA